VNVQIRLVDGRTFAGTAMDIVSELRDSWADFYDNPAASIEDYVGFIRRQLRGHRALEIDVRGDSEEALADSLLGELQRVGLACQPN
jgi:hypothetical protein